MGNIVNRVFESAGPDGKVRGTPQQIIDKYQVLARDAQVSGDRVAAENYLQHAEHYARLLGEAQRQSQESRQHERDDRDDRDEGPDRQQHQPRRQPQSEPAGLVTIGSDDHEVGPVDTPEAAAWSREDVHPPAEQAERRLQEAAPQERPAFQVVNGREDHPEEARPAEAAADEGEPSPPPKRTRSRRKSKPASEVIEASAE